LDPHGEPYRCGAGFFSIEVATVHVNDPVVLSADLSAIEPVSDFRFRFLGSFTITNSENFGLVDKLDLHRVLMVIRPAGDPSRLARDPHVDSAPLALAFLADIFGQVAEVPYARAKVALDAELQRWKESGIEVQDSAGVIHYCWPALSMREYVPGE